MKKVFVVAVLSVFALASCKKDYTCECEISGDTISGTYTEVINDTKKKAEEKCDSYDESANGQTIECEIK